MKKEINFSASARAFKPLVYTGEFQLAEVKVNGKTYSCILKDLQFDKVSDALNHVDLLELVEDKKVIATLPLKFTGAAAGVKEGGKLITKMKSIKVKTFPKYLKEHIEVDITNLELNGNIRVEDVKADNMEILNSPRISVCISSAYTPVEAGRSNCASCNCNTCGCCRTCKTCSRSSKRREGKEEVIFQFLSISPILCIGFFIVRLSHIRQQILRY